MNESGRVMSSGSLSVGRYPRFGRTNRRVDCRSIATPTQNGPHNLFSRLASPEVRTGKTELINAVKLRGRCLMLTLFRVSRPSGDTPYRLCEFSDIALGATCPVAARPSEDRDVTAGAASRNAAIMTRSLRAKDDVVKFQVVGPRVGPRLSGTELTLGTERLSTRLLRCARDDTVSGGHCEERSDEAIPPTRATVG